MKILLDTCVWIWLLESPEKLPRRVVGALNELGIPHVSAISPWEVSKKCSIGKLTLSSSLRSWLGEAVAPGVVELVPLTPDIAAESCELPGEFHGDPADQIIVASARVCGMTLITCDEKILGYRHVSTLWK